MLKSTDAILNSNYTREYESARDGRLQSLVLTRWRTWLLIENRAEFGRSITKSTTAGEEKKKKKDRLNSRDNDSREKFGSFFFLEATLILPTTVVRTLENCLESFAYFSSSFFFTRVFSPR